MGVFAPRQEQHESTSRYSTSVSNRFERWPSIRLNLGIPVGCWQCRPREEEEQRYPSTRPVYSETERPQANQGNRKPDLCDELQLSAMSLEIKSEARRLVLCVIERVDVQLEIVPASQKQDHAEDGGKCGAGPGWSAGRRSSKNRLGAE